MSGTGGSGVFPTPVGMNRVLIQCHCADCSKDPLPTYTEQYRHECEIRYIANNDYNWIKMFLDGVEKERGIEARKILEIDLSKPVRHQNQAPKRKGNII